jgi:hypothetical protein
MDEQARTDTSSRQGTYGSPSAKVWGLYLSQAEKVTKEQSESWTANTDGVLVFVRRSLFVVVGIVLKATLWLVRSFIRHCGFFYFGRLHELTTKFERHHQSPPFYNFSAVGRSREWNVLAIAGGCS